ncbi:hypothetical protein PHMEG_00018603 [Phytophthora megakarya]|uniref:Tyr recombinase domain-containing protein n=1 Tax=Phytophthora megakarya TaxID=4795 RepID=A0A225VUZ3_9STRA|nr:hypothetical protein PHMEG_00018603 [Phytophthora megakarya]
MSNNQVQRTNSKSKMYRVTLMFRGSKTHQLGVATSRIMAITVRTVLALLKENSRLPPHAQLCWADNAIGIRKEAEACDYQSSRYGAHSFRAGGATALYQAGCDDSTIKLQGR